MIVQPADLVSVLPELLLTVFACFVLLAGLSPRLWRGFPGVASLVGIALAATASARLGKLSYSAFSSMFILDPYATFFKFVFYIGAAVTVLLSIQTSRSESANSGEYYAFVLLSTVGMMFMVSGSDLISIYLGLELMSVCLYVLAGINRPDNRSVEASVKYFVLGSFSSAILIYGISLLYGLTGSTNLQSIAAFLSASEMSNPALMLSMFLLIVGFGFKVAAVPFHMWTPDVYEGSPTSVTAFMSVGPKAAAFGVILRVFMETFGANQPAWSSVLVVLSIATMAIGNLVAVAQTNIKRMLAYSSIAHAGYVLIGVVVGSAEGISGVMFYLFVYAFMNLGAFGMVILLQRGGMGGERIEDFTGLAKKNRIAALLMLIFMFSLTGVPPLAGFWAKFYIFKAAIEAGYAWLAVVGVLLSAVSAFYYLRIVMVMYMKEPEGDFALSPAPGLSLALFVSVAMIVLLGIYPGGLIDMARAMMLQIP